MKDKYEIKEKIDPEAISKFFWVDENDTVYQVIDKETGKVVFEETVKDLAEMWIRENS